MSLFTGITIAIIAFFAEYIDSAFGGGYGPLVTGGQLLSGVRTKNAVGITTLSEGLTCLIGIIIYFITVPRLDLKIAPYITIGAMLSVPLAAFTVKRINPKIIKAIIGILTLILGLLTVAKTVFF